jgi:uncharacterized membrane protein YphA (DoxX/SURF4 family)
VQALHTVRFYSQFHCAAGKLLRPLDGLPALALHLYVVPVFWVAGSNKYNSFDATVAWFGSSDAGLDLPLPTLMALLAVGVMSA